MEVETMNLTAWYFAQKLVRLEAIEGGKVDVSCASAGSATDKRFLQSLKKQTTPGPGRPLSSSLVACESHTVETWTGTTHRLQIDVRRKHCYP